MREVSTTYLGEQRAGQIEPQLDIVDLSLSEAKRIASNATEKRYSQQALTHNQGDVTELARLTGINQSHLQHVLKKHEMSSRDFCPVKTNRENNPLGLFSPE